MSLHLSIQHTDCGREDSRDEGPRSGARRLKLKLTSRARLFSLPLRLAVYIVKDLVPDLTQFYKQYKSIEPYLKNDNPPAQGQSSLLRSVACLRPIGPGRETRQSPESVSHELTTFPRVSLSD